MRHKDCINDVDHSENEQYSTDTQYTYQASILAEIADHGFFSIFKFANIGSSINLLVATSCWLVLGVSVPHTAN